MPSIFPVDSNATSTLNPLSTERTRLPVRLPRNSTIISPSIAPSFDGQFNAHHLASNPGPKDCSVHQVLPDSLLNNNGSTERRSTRPLAVKTYRHHRASSGKPSYQHRWN